MREKESSGDIKTLQEFYGFKEYINTFGIKHPYPHGKIKVFQKLWFHVSHLMWSKKLISNYFKNDTDNHFLTRSDWVAYFLAKQGSKVTFECHQTSKVRDFVIKRIGNLQNVKLVFLNEILKNDYGSVRNSIVLHNAADEALFSSNEKKDDNLIIFLGNLNRFKDSRGINEIVSWFSDNYLKENFKLEIIGGSILDCENLDLLIKHLGLSNYIKTSPWVSRKIAAEKLSRSKIGLLLNTSKNKHSYFHTSPLKYFEYLMSGLTVVAVDFPSHRTLPMNENIIFFESNNKNEFINALKKVNDSFYLTKSERYSISLNYRVEKLINFIF